MSAVLPACAALTGSGAPVSRPAWAAEVSMIIEQLGVRSLMDIHQGTHRVGRLWLIGAVPEAGMPTTARLVGAAWLAVLAFALGSALSAGRRWLRRHRL